MGSPYGRIRKLGYPLLQVESEESRGRPMSTFVYARINRGLSLQKLSILYTNIEIKFERLPVYHRSNKIATIGIVFIGCFTNRKYTPMIISGIKSNTSISQKTMFAVIGNNT